MLRMIAVFRGVAALFVVVYHSALYEGLLLHNGPIALEPIANRLSIVGVTTFFCLSGYLMARLVEREPFGRFASKRLLRIYPPFLAAALITIFASKMSWLTIGDYPAVALTLLPVGTIERPLGIEWTLVYEIVYYGVTSLFCFSATRQFFPALVVLWTGVVLTAFIGFGQYGTDFQPPASEILFSVWNLGFLVGALGRFAERAGWARPVWVFPGLLLLAISEHWGLGYRHVVIPIALGLIILAAVSWEKRRGGVALPRWALRLGDASYGIYLLHLTVIRYLVEIVGAEATLPTGVFTAMAFGLSVFFATPFGLLEYGAHRWASRRWFSRGVET